MKKGILLAAALATAAAAPVAAYDPIVYPTNAPAGVVVAPTDVSSEFSDLLARTVATNATTASVELLRAFIADLYATVETMPGSEGWDAALDALIAASFSNCVTRTEASAFATKAGVNAALAALGPEAVGALPANGYGAVTNAADIGPDPWFTLSFSAQDRMVRVTGTGTNYVSGVYAPNGVECHFLASGFDALLWPTNAAVVRGADAYDPERENAYSIRAVNGTPLVEWLFAK